MDVKEMHELFRLLGQQMGIERVRGILPHSIDGYLNAAIIDIVNNLLRVNTQESLVRANRYKILPQESLLTPVNSLSTLYKEENLSLKSISDDNTELITFKSKDKILYLYDFVINYEGDGRYRHCRFIEPNKVEETLDDYLNRASRRYPIITVVSVDESKDEYKFEVYCGQHLYIENLKLRYIKVPNTVKFDVDSNNNLTSNAVNCDLPIHLHKDIVELAVQKYFSSVGSTTQKVNK